MAVVNWTIMAIEDVIPCIIEDRALLIRFRRAVSPFRGINRQNNGTFYSERKA
jgi:hypothetical protein